MVKECVFCGRSAPEVKMSKEHVLRAALLKYMVGTTTSLTLRQRHHVEDDGSTFERTLELPLGPFDRTVNRVCKPCNEGWLNLEVEMPAEPAIAALIRGEPLMIGQAAGAALALWAAKTAAVRALMDDGRPAVQPEDYRFICANLRPPPNTYVWVASTEYCMRTFDRHCRMVIPDNITEPTALGHLTTFFLGHFAFFVAGATDNDDGRYLLDAVRANLDMHDTLRIWPPGRVGTLSRLQMPLYFARKLSDFVLHPADVIVNPEITWQAQPQPWLAREWNPPT